MPSPAPALSSFFLIAGLLACTTAAAAQKPAPAPAKPATKPAATQPSSSAGQSARAAQPVPGGSTGTCDYVTPDEAKALLGAEATATTAPSKGLFTSCGYTSPTGDTVTVYVSDYGLPVVAQQFFEKARAELKTATDDDTLGVPAFSHVTPPTAAVASAPAAGTTPRTPASQRQPNPPPATGTGTPGAVMLLAVKEHRTVKLEAAGPTAGQPPQLPKLRAIVTRVLGTLPAADAAAPPR